jgi:hypothetical protein
MEYDKEVKELREIIYNTVKHRALDYNESVVKHGKVTIIPTKTFFLGGYKIQYFTPTQEIKIKGGERMVGAHRGAVIDYFDYSDDLSKLRQLYLYLKRNKMLLL